MQPIDFPDFKDWSIVAVHLLQGVVYAEETKHWSVLLRYRNELELFFIRIGLMLIVDEGEEFAYLRQLNEDEKVDGYENIPILFRRKTITKDASYLCVLLRDTLHQFDESLNDSRTSRCTITTDELLEQWKAFFLPDNDGKKVLDKFNRALATVEDLKYIEKLNGQETAVEKLRKLRQRVKRFKDLSQLLSKLESPTLEKSLVFLDDKLLPSTSNAVERGNRRHRKMQKTVYRVRVHGHIEDRIALDMFRDAHLPGRRKTLLALHLARNK